MKVLIVDDHPIVVRGCIHLLRDAGVTRFISATNAGDALEVYRDVRPDIVILDLAMAGDDGNGLRFIRRLRQVNWRTPIMVLSFHSDPGLVAKAVRLGANAYVLKDAPAAEFLEAFRRAIAGERYINEALARQIAFAGGRPTSRSKNASVRSG